MSAPAWEDLQSCPLCDGTGLRPYCCTASLFEPGEWISYRRCAECDVVFRSPRPTPEIRLERYVDRPLIEQETALLPHSQLHYWYMLAWVRRLLSPVARLPLRLLDFGCGAGGLLLEARAAGFEVLGLEVNRRLAAWVESTHGLRVFSTTIDDPSFREAPFDVITSSQVFEHLTDPRGTLAGLKGHLRPGGILLIEVPNLHDVRERLQRGATMDDSHLFYFNRRSLPGMLRRAGFEVLRIDEGLRPFRLLGERARHLPLPLLATAERLASALQIKTILGVIARLPG